MSNKASSSDHFWAENWHDVILGGQDGLVNVLGIILGMAVATNDTRLILLAGLAATFAESISMAAVAYTSTQTERDYSIRKQTDAGTAGDHHAAAHAVHNPLLSALVVGGSALVGSFVPLLPYFFTNVSTATTISLIVSAVTLFVVGALKAHFTIGDWRRSGLELMLIGMLAAFVGYIVGVSFKIS